MLKREIEYRKLNPCGRGCRHKYQIFIVFLDSLLVFPISFVCNIQLSFCFLKDEKRQCKEFQHNIPPRRPSSVYQKGVSVPRTACVSPSGILQPVLQPEQTDRGVHVKNGYLLFNSLLQARPKLLIITPMLGLQKLRK